MAPDSQETEGSRITCETSPCCGMCLTQTRRSVSRNGDEVSQRTSKSESVSTRGPRTRNRGHAAALGKRASPHPTHRTQFSSVHLSIALPISTFNLSWFGRSPRSQLIHCSVPLPWRAACCRWQPCSSLLSSPLSPRSVRLRQTTRCGIPAPLTRSGCFRRPQRPAAVLAACPARLASLAARAAAPTAERAPTVLVRIRHLANER